MPTEVQQVQMLSPDDAVVPSEELESDIVANHLFSILGPTYEQNNFSVENWGLDVRKQTPLTKVGFVQLVRDADVQTLDDAEVQGKVIDLRSHTATDACVEFPRASSSKELSQSLTAGVDEHDTTSDSMPEAIVGCPFPILCLHLKNLGHFVRLEVDVLDEKRREFTFAFANSQTVVRCEHRAHRCSMPLRLTDRWSV
ncbi:MAG: hypothetical protein MHM6MM_005553 [Cercozoa sp. M6MM]